MTKGREGISPVRLQKQLRDLLCLAVVADHVRWVLRGDGVSDLKQWLAAAAQQWRAWADEVAICMAACDAPPDGRVRSLAEDIPFNWVPEGWLGAGGGRRLVVERLGRVTSWAKARADECTAPEERSLFEKIRSGLETQLASLPSDEA